MVNPHFSQLSSSYLFPRMQKEIDLHKESTEKSILHLGIGDIAEPIVPTVIDAMVEATKEMGKKDTFKGYPPSLGYMPLRKAIAENDYAKEKIHPEEIFISDGAKCDLSHLQELFSSDATVAVGNPSYPVYADTSILYGRAKGKREDGTYHGLSYLPMIKENNFQARPPKNHSDFVYLCSPNNPTGSSLSREILEKWLDYANKHECTLIYDGAYSAFIQSDAPKSIYEIEGAKKRAIEVRSFSKSAGFTNLRCSYTVIPKELQVKGQFLHPLWKRRMETRFNGVSYPIQMAALSTFSVQGKKEISAQIQRYQQRAKKLYTGLLHLGFEVYGGFDAPYVWCKTNGLSSWNFFLLLLTKANVVSTPGSGFGSLGENYVRFSAFQTEEIIAKALTNIKKACNT